MNTLYKTDCGRYVLVVTRYFLWPDLGQHFRYAMAVGLS